MTISGGTKACPKCAERVKAEAKVCRYCRHSFSREEAREELIEQFRRPVQIILIIVVSIALLRIVTHLVSFYKTA